MRPFSPPPASVALFSSLFLCLLLALLLVAVPGMAQADGLSLLGTTPQTSVNGPSDDLAGNVVWRWTNSTSRTDDGTPYPGNRPDRTEWLLGVLGSLRGLDLPTLGRLAALASSKDDDRIAIVHRGLETLSPQGRSFDEVLALSTSLRGSAGSRLAAELIPSTLQSWAQLETLMRDATFSEGNVAYDDQKPVILAAGVRYLAGEKGVPLDADTFARLLFVLPRWTSFRADSACELLGYVSDLDDEGLATILRVVDSEMGRNKVRSAYDALRASKEA